MSDFNYCTLFNFNYLSRGLVLYQSLCEVHPEFSLYIFAFDNQTRDYLKQLELEHAVIIGLDEFEDDSLLKIKPSRTFVEYCWTCTPSVIKYSIEKYNLTACTYLDADLYFYSSPNPIFSELTGNSIGLSPHNYSPDYDKSLVSGKYCVQFVFFKNSLNGIKALSWWRNECINWCYSRVEKGKFGDQMYLDSFSSLFEELHIIENKGAGIAPWNIQNYSFKNIDSSIFGSLNGTSNFPVVFFHFHYLKTDFKKKLINLNKYEYSNDVINIFYLPYIEKLLKYHNLINATDYDIKQFRFVTPNRLQLKYLRVIRRLGENRVVRRLYNLFFRS